ncbi:MAG: sugar transferase [Acidimicrobiales bacterium]
MTASSPFQDAPVPEENTWSEGRARTLRVVPDHVRRVRPYERWVKRGFDFVGGLVLLVLLSPVLMVTAIAVRIRLGSPVFFKQVRIGQDGEPFEVLKFRSMRQDRRQHGGQFSGHDRRRVHKTNDDPRHTSLGRRIRKTSLDELPQLLNVVRGEMSLVGPRPELAHIAEQHDLVDHPRHQVRPGMTGLWQVSPDRQGMLYENVDKDLEYVEHITLVGDVKILFRTLGAVGRGSGS